MTQKNYYDRPYGCSVEATLSVMGGRWKSVIIFNLLQNDVLRFGELKKKINGVTQRILTNQLRELERDQTYRAKSLCRSTAASRIFANRLWSHS